MKLKKKENRKDTEIRKNTEIRKENLRIKTNKDEKIIRKDSEIIDIKRDLEFFKANDVVIFGSYLTQNYNKNSDIDVAIITHIAEKSKNIEFLKNILEKIRNPYDIKIFELLPPHLQISVINNYIVIFGDPLDISEYLYYYRKLWNDMKYRYKENQFKDSKEQLELMNNLEFLNKKANF